MEANDGGQALYRKYRSKSLDEIVGQQHVTEILKRSLAQGKIAHAYLLTGPRGVGKTSIARILAHEINQLPYNDESTHLDIIEIDAASNNGVDDVRDLRDKVQIAPVSAKRKVYIIDEVHMLSKAAFNALLKTLEEPPEHIVFILATTDLHKVPATIISRTQHFAFRSISRTDLVLQLRAIATAEKLTIDDAALETIAERGGGSFRDSISLLDQLSSFADKDNGIDAPLIQSLLGLAGNDAIEQLITAVEQHSPADVIAHLDTFEQAGIQATTLTEQLIRTIRTQLASKPQLVMLLDSLIDVLRSPQPDLKLLTVLVHAAKPKSATATAAPAPAISKPVAELVKQAPKQPSAPIRKAIVEPPAPKAPVAAAKPAVGEQPVAPKPARKKSSEPIVLDWSMLLNETRENHLALHSVLQKCTYVLEEDTLTLYTSRKFNKTKIDDPRYVAKLHEALALQGIYELTIVTIPSAAPPADEKLAEIAAMMGGGQEVSLDE